MPIRCAPAGASPLGRASGPPRGASPWTSSTGGPAPAAVANAGLADLARVSLELDGRRVSRPPRPETGGGVLDGLLYRDAPHRLDQRVRQVWGRRVFERYAENPGAPVAVLVHGVGVSGRYWLPTAGRLAERCSVYVPDLLGFGRSGRLPGRPTVRRLADLLEAWLDAAGHDRPDVVAANSFGCQFAVDLAAREPERVARLVLVGPTVDRRARSLPRQLGRLALDVTREPPALAAVQAVDYTLHVAKSGVAAFAEMLRDPIEASLPRVQAPTLVVRGGRDPVVPRAWAEEVAAALPRGRLVEVAGAPHAVNFAAPDALTGLILGLLGLRERAA
jgi:pimeloyl-ACP methyl ester carboxylesterase